MQKENLQNFRIPLKDSQKNGEVPNGSLIHNEHIYSYLAQIDNNSSVTDSDYHKIKEAYNKWNSNYYVVVYGEDAKWACNLFVGETLYMAGKKSLTPSFKYYSAMQIWNAEGIFKKIKKEDVQKGDIVAFGGKHVEIVTNITEKGLIFKEKTSFYSRGAGRGPTDFGTERCSDSPRQVSNKNIKFLRVY